MSDLYTSTYNPDVLSCLANLSNDEVFTPPSVVNAMLDMLPQELFSDPNATFLDPACKSGVFLREIAKRLLVGLAEQIPDLQERIDHIFHKQLFGIGITELTSLLARRSVYCSKYPNSVYSVSAFDDSSGNIRFKRIQHRWKNGRCEWCGASEDQFGEKKREGLETHAYEFIHTGKLEEIFGMKFDVIIGNPPYQLSDGGHSASAMPIYQRFVEQAQKLNPRYLAMIVPSRWFAGGRGLDNFRIKMLNDKRLRRIVDFFNSNDCFPGVDISGGICYFLWERDNPGDCVVTTNFGDIHSNMERPLLEEGTDIFIRFNKAVGIYRKIAAYREETFNTIVSANDPFGFDVREQNSYKRIKPDFHLKKTSEDILFYYNGWRENGVGYIARTAPRKGIDLISMPKIMIAQAYGERGGFPYLVIGKPFLVPAESCCAETYLVIGPFESDEITTHVMEYIKTRFFRFLVLLLKNTQHAPNKVYSLVPLQDFTEAWPDKKLYAKYGLTDDEVAFIESLIRPME